MKSGMVKGLITGAVIGGSAAMMYGIMNWQNAAGKTDDLTSRF